MRLEGAQDSQSGGLVQRGHGNKILQPDAAIRLSQQFENPNGLIENFYLKARHRKRSSACIRRDRARGSHCNPPVLRFDPQILRLAPVCQRYFADSLLFYRQSPTLELVACMRFMLGDVHRSIGSLVESRRPCGARLVQAGEIVISGCEFRRRKDCQTLAVFDEERRRHNDSHRSQLRPSSMAVRAPAIRRPIQVVYDTDQADVCTEDWALSSWN